MVSGRSERGTDGWPFGEGVHEDASEALPSDLAEVENGWISMKLHRFEHDFPIETGHSWLRSCFFN